MKNYSVQIVLASIAMFSTTLHAQDTNIRSYTDADLIPQPSVSTPTEPYTTNDIDTSSTEPKTSFKYPSLTPEQLQQVQDQMNAQVRNAEQRVQILMNKIQDSSRVPMSIDKVELEGAITDLDVKKTLVSKFAGSPSLKSPKVRQILMGVLNKKFIQESDLATLQATVDAERPYTYP